MFFYLGPNCPVQALTQVEPDIFLDQGWSNKSGCWYKGYSTEVNLETSLDEILSGYQPAGKWCVIKDGHLFHPKFRGFPLYHKNNHRTNINIQGYSVVTYDYKIEPVDGQLTLDEVSEIVQDVLLENTENFLKYNAIERMNVLFSGGLDTLTSWTVYDKITKNYNLHIYLPKPQDRTLSTKLGRIREYQSDLIDNVDSHWGYNVSSIFKEKNWYITGFYAEVLTYRDAEAISAIANYYDKYIDELAMPNDYLYWFLKRPVLEKYKQEKQKFDNIIDLKKYLWSTIFYDHQMWHIDNNFTFNPFFDIRIPLALHKLSADDLKKNCVTGQVQRNIISKLNPAFLKLLSDYKNEKNIWFNFQRYFRLLKLDPAVKILVK